MVPLWMKPNKVLIHYWSVLLTEAPIVVTGTIADRQGAYLVDSERNKRHLRRKSIGPLRAVLCSSGRESCRYYRISI